MVELWRLRLIRSCGRRKDLIQGSELQLRALVEAKSSTVLGRRLGPGSSMEHGGKSGFRVMLKPVERWGLQRIRDGQKVRLHRGGLLNLE